MTHSTIRFRLIKLITVMTLFFGMVMTSCSKKDSGPAPVPTDKAALAAAIAIAQGLISNTVEGTRPGNYEVGSKAPLNTALTAATGVNTNGSATQASINNAVAQLNAAIAAYNSHLINEIAAVNLIGFWKFNGNAIDSSGKGNHGTVTAGHAYFGAGMATLTADRFGRANSAYHFDKGGNVTVPYASALNSPAMTLSLWVKWTGAGRTINADTYTMIAMNRWNGYKFQLQGGHLPFYTVKVVRAVGDTTIYDRDDAGVALAENTWRHVVVTFKSGEMKFYIDGSLVTTWPTPTGDGAVPGTALSLVNPINFVIGQDLPTNKYLLVDGDFQVAWGGFWTGDMDDVMYYNIALDGPQVTSIYNNQKTL